MEMTNPTTPSSQPGRLPSYLIIGAAKCATSWLQQCLRDHPGAYMPAGEPHHFSFLYDAEDPLPAHYQERFAEAEPHQVVGENSNTYLPHPDCARRIRDTLPDVKLILSLRNPVTRVYSDYAMRIRQQGKLKDMERFIDPDHAPDYWFLHKGLYYQQISQWLEYFPRDQMLILITDDYKSDAQGQFAKLCRFIGIDDTYDPSSLSTKVNTKDTGMVFPRLRRRIRENAMGRCIDGLLSGPVFKRVLHKLLARNPSVPPLDDKLRQKLCDFYREDVTKLSEFIGRDLSHWVNK